MLESDAVKVGVGTRIHLYHACGGRGRSAPDLGYNELQIRIQGDGRPAHC